MKALLALLVASTLPVADPQPAVGKSPASVAPYVAGQPLFPGKPRDPYASIFRSGRRDNDRAPEPRSRSESDTPDVRVVCGLTIVHVDSSIDPHMVVRATRNPDPTIAIAPEICVDR